MHYFDVESFFCLAEDIKTKKQVFSSAIIGGILRITMSVFKKDDAFNFPIVIYFVLPYVISIFYY